MGFGTWKDFNNAALRMLWNENAEYARQGRSKRVDYRDCVKVLMIHFYNHNKTRFSTAGVSRFHRNLIAYSFLTTSKKIGAMFRNFKVGGKSRQDNNDGLAKRSGLGVTETAMEFLCRHTEQVGKLVIAGEDHRLFLCLDDLTMMFFAMCEGQRELGVPRMPRGCSTRAEMTSRLSKSLTETVQKLEKQEGCPDIKLGRVYPVCLSNDKFHLNLAFPLEGSEATAPVPRPPTQERGQGERTVLETYSLASMTAKINPEPEVPEVVEIDDDEEDDELECTFSLATRTVVGPDRPSTLLTIKVDQPKPMSNFAAALARMHEECQKRTSLDSEDNPRETRRRKSTESGDNTDNEIATGTAILDLNSPHKPTTVVESRYEEYFTIEGQKARFKNTAGTKTNVFDRLGPARAEDDEILAEAMEAEKRAEEELQARIKRLESDRREQERRQWEEEARIREQQ